MPSSRRRLRPTLPTVSIALAGTIALAAAGCGSAADDSSGAGAGDAGSVDVVATTTVLGDVARAVGGDAVSVQQLLQPNSDPHDYEPRPGDVLAAAKAQLVLASGEGLDDWAADIVEESGGDATLVDVGASLPTLRESEDGQHADDEDANENANDPHADEDGHAASEAGHEDEAAHADEAGHADDEEAGHDGHDHGPIDPHWWHDPTNVEAAVATVRAALTRANPDGRALYARNAAAYVAKLRALDAGIRRCLDAIPPDQRKIVTDHDALGYLADRYGLEVVGAVIPSASTQAQASAGDVTELARVIRREGVRAVFPESGANRKLPEAVARETGATAEHQLYGDTLGPEGSDAATYLGMERHNADAIVRGLTGGARGCEIAGL